MVRRIKTQKFGKKAVFIKRGGRGGPNIESAAALRLKREIADSKVSGGSDKKHGSADGEQASGDGRSKRLSKGSRPIVARPDKWAHTTVRGDMSHALRLARSGGVPVKSRSAMPAVQALGPMLQRFKRRLQPRRKDYNGQGLARPTIFIELKANGLRSFMTEFNQIYSEHINEWSGRHLKQRKTDQDLAMEWRVRLQQKQRRDALAAACSRDSGNNEQSAGHGIKKKTKRKQGEKSKSSGGQNAVEAVGAADQSFVRIGENWSQAGSGGRKLSAAQAQQGQGALLPVGTSAERKKKRHASNQKLAHMQKTGGRLVDPSHKKDTDNVDKAEQAAMQQAARLAYQRMKQKRQAAASAANPVRTHVSWPRTATPKGQPGYILPGT
eukprot:SAG31_NODE_1169_length_9565_cov_3.703571_1_plen_382_part_00